MRISAAATALHRQLDRGFAAPHQPVGARGAQCLDELARATCAASPSNARGARSRARARGRCAASSTASQRHVDVRDHVTLDARPIPPPRPNNPEPMTPGSSPGTSEMNNASARRPPSSRAMPPPLMRESLARSPLSVAMSQPAARPWTLSARRSLERNAVAQRFHQARAAARHQEQRQYVGGQFRDAPLERRARGSGCARRARDARLSSMRDVGSRSAQDPRGRSLVITSMRSMRSPSASRAPRAMALAALPMANTSTGTAAAGARRNSRDACATIHRAQRGVEQLEENARAFTRRARPAIRS